MPDPRSASRAGMPALALLAGSVLLALAAMLAPFGQARGAEPETAVFAGGCFWCVEEAFDKVDGVLETVSGYAGGSVANPTYEQVSFGNTGHAEVVRVRFDPARVSYAQLLDTYWRNTDLFDGGGQFCDRGPPYKPFIFTTSAIQAKAANQSKQALAKTFDRSIAVEIRPLDAFYPAEDYHQNYHNTNALQYKFYKWNCGRAQRLEKIWGKPQS